MVFVISPYSISPFFFKRGETPGLRGLMEEIREEEVRQRRVNPPKPDNAMFKSRPLIFDAQHSVIFAILSLDFSSVCSLVDVVWCNLYWIWSHSNELPYAHGSLGKRMVFVRQWY